jgi:hypothetical protein
MLLLLLLFHPLHLLLLLLLLLLLPSLAWQHGSVRLHQPASSPGLLSPPLAAAPPAAP